MPAKAKDKSPLPFYSPEIGQDQQGTNRYFILIENSRITKAIFLSFDNSMVRFDTKTDAQLFCKMANASFITFPYTTK